MKFSAMEWYRRANMACLGGGADIVSPDESPLENLDTEDLCAPEDPEDPFDWGDEPEDPQSNEPFEKENNV